MTRLLGTVKEHGSSILVALLSSAFGVSLLQVTGLLTQVIQADPYVGDSGTVGVMLLLVAIVFLVIALYVGAVVTANTFATIIAGRVRTIALLRLVGSSAAQQRRAVAREGLTVGIVGALLGALVGTGISALISTVAVAQGVMPDLGYEYLSPVLALPIVAVVLTTWLASWNGSRRVLSVSPIAATGGAQEAPLEELGRKRAKNTTAVTLVVVGGALLAGGVLLGTMNPAGVLVGLLGGVLSFTGIVFAAPVVMPRVLRALSLLLGRGVPARLASANALRYPERSARTTIGLVIGVTLVTMFGVVTETFQTIIRQAQEMDPETYYGVDEAMAITVTVFTVLLGFSALLAAVGMVNNLSLSVLQRTRELGLLRALGLSVKQLRGMIGAESVLLAAAALLFGVLLGTVYGWAGAQSLLGTSVEGSIVLPTLPWAMIGILVAASALLAAVAALLPARRATRLQPVAALAVD